ncbi:MAG TPA: hypothetical protein VGH27_33080 [Streptosporangiaceae bacterium]|jgi:hypothetical protein
MRALLVPAAGLTLVAGVPPVGAATTPATHAPPAVAQALPAIPGVTPTAAAADDTLSGAATVKTSNGVSWTFSVADANDTGGLVIGLSRTATTGGAGDEEHVWMFNTKASSLKFTKSTGDATAIGGAATGKVATVDLTFKATSHKAATCSSGSETIYTGTLTGELELVTGLTGGGTVGSKSVTFNAPDTTPQVTVDSDCIIPTDDCLATTLFGAGQETTNEAVGLTETSAGKLFDFVSVVHEAKLTTPKGAERTDLALVQAAAPAWDSGTGVLSISTSTSGIVTGSATLSGGKDTTTSAPCTWQGKKYTVKTTQNESAKYASPAGKAITAHTSLTGNLAAPSAAKDAVFFIETVS